jgi:uncharacterized protein involved in cysteine biosynthesis
MCAVPIAEETCRSVSGESVEGSATVDILKDMVEMMRMEIKKLRGIIKIREREINTLYNIIDQWKRNCKEK